MDLYDRPFNILHELYYYTFTVAEEREKARKEEQKKREEEQKKKEPKKLTPRQFDRRLSPAAQAKANKEMKESQDDVNKGSEDKSKSQPELASPPNVDIEDIVDIMEEGV